MRMAPFWIVCGLWLSAGCARQAATQVAAPTQNGTPTAPISTAPVGSADKGPKDEKPTKADVKGTEWTHWRGPLQNGVSFERDLPDKFSAEPADKNNLVWKADAGSRTNPVVHNGRIFLIGPIGEGMDHQERVFALDANTGKQLWEYRFNVFHTDIVSDRLGWSNVGCDPETGNVYVHSTAGILYCFEPSKGKVLWSKSLTEEYGRVSGYGGRITSPIVDEDKVIIGLINASWGENARGGNRFVAFDKKTGDVIWWAATGGQTRNTYFSTPVVAVINGQRLLISGGADGGVHAFQARTGKKVWSYTISNGSINCSPVVEGTRVYIAHGDENVGSSRQGKVICLDAGQVEKGQPKVAWQVDGPKIKFASPILHKGRLYVADDTANLFCFNAEDGKQVWKMKYGRNSMGSPVLGDGKIYLTEVNNKFVIARDAGTKGEKLHEQNFESTQPGVVVELNGSPAVAYGRVYFSTSEATYCIGKPDHKAEPDKVPATPEEPAEKGKPTLLQVLPADVDVAPGASVSFKARLFDDNGRFVKDTEAKWELAPFLAPPPLPGVTPPPGPQPPMPKGELKASTYTAPKDVNGQYGRVVASAEGVTGYARVRQPVVAPYKQDFEKVPENRTPGGWVNSMGKFAVRKMDDSNVLVKLATNPSPLFARANAFLGAPAMTDYTIEADVSAAAIGGDQADAGVVANRYTLVLVGNTQSLRLISWDALPRIDKTITYNWKPKTWYRLKLAVEQQGDKCVARGKVWERGQAEPEKWTLEVTDTSPNKEGAPALYANAVGFVGDNPGAEVYFDNVVVSPNKK